MSGLDSSAVRPQLCIGIFPDSSALARSLEQTLSRERYAVYVPNSDNAFFQLIEHEKQRLDCIVLQDTPKLRHLVNWLHSQATVLPLVIVEADPNAPESSEHQKSPDSNLSFIYHSAEVWLPLRDIARVSDSIDHAIEAFLNLSPACQLTSSLHPSDPTRDLSTQNFLMLQQRRLSEKLKERLGYLGVYYKRDPKNFLRYLPPEDRQQFLTQLRRDYREIILTYFQDASDLNQKIDNFVNNAFFADISVSQIVETHMELMDEFAKQLKLEGRSEEVLLDYRLTLIDTIAHLCEMYRRSIPRES